MAFTSIKKPRRSGVWDRSSRNRVLLVACTDDFDFHTAVLGAAGCSFVACNRLLLAFAFGIDAIGFDAFRYQIRLDCFRAAHGQFLVVCIGADGVGMADGDNDFQVHAYELGYQIVELGFAVRLQHSLIEVKESIGGKSDFFGSRGGCRSRSGRRSRGRSSGRSGRLSDVAVAADGLGIGWCPVAGMQAKSAAAPHYIAAAILSIVAERLIGGDPV